MSIREVIARREEEPAASADRLTMPGRTAHFYLRKSFACYTLRMRICAQILLILSAPRR
jgi:hypothetical protein